MGEFFMGQMLDQPELPANSPRPPETPPDGIIVTDIDADGYTRRYLYKAMNGESDEVMISETPTGKASGVAVAVADVPEQVNEPYLASEEPPPHLEEAADPYLGEAQVPQAPTSKPLKIPPIGTTVVQPGVMPQVAAVRPNVSPSLQGSSPLRVPGGSVEAPIGHGRPMPAQSAPSSPSPISVSPIPGRDGIPSLAGVVSPNIELGRSVQVSPQTLDQGPAQTPSAFQVSHPDMDRKAPIRAQGGSLGASKSVLQNSQRPIGGPTSVFNKEVPLRGHGAPSLGQAQAPSPAPANQPASSMEAPPANGKCPGAVEMPDGRVIQPEDFVNLSDFCELFPFLMQTYAAEAAKTGLAPGQKVPVVGQSPAANGAVPSTTPFGAAGNGPYGRTGGGFVSGGGGPGPAGARGFQGPIGPMGAPGAAAIDTLSKIDGAFTVGPGAFVAVPGTLLSFSTAEDGNAVFLLQAILGNITGVSGESESGQIGLRIDGTDYIIATRLLHTMAVGVSEYQVAQAGSITISLLASSHMVEVVARGLGVGEFGGTGLGTLLTVQAGSSNPLNVTVLHR